MADEKKVLRVNGRADWHRWLEANHSISPGVWLVLAKKRSGGKGIAYGDALEEALSFGWIDGRANRGDEGSYKVMFTPRRRGSQWSGPNKHRVENLIERGLMAPAGMAKVEAAKLDGSWYLLEGVEQEVVPEDLMKALENAPGAKDAFFGMPSSHRKWYLFWIKEAKRPETRTRRIEGTISMALGERRGRNKG